MTNLTQLGVKNTATSNGGGINITSNMIKRPFPVNEEYEDKTYGEVSGKVIYISEELLWKQ